LACWGSSLCRTTPSPLPLSPRHPAALAPPNHPLPLYYTIVISYRKSGRRKMSKKLFVLRAGPLLPSLSLSLSLSHPLSFTHSHTMRLRADCGIFFFSFLVVESHFILWQTQAHSWHLPQPNPLSTSLTNPLPTPSVALRQGKKLVKHLIATD